MPSSMRPSMNRLRSASRTCGSSSLMSRRLLCAAAGSRWGFPAGSPFWRPSRSHRRQTIARRQDFVRVAEHIDDNALGAQGVARMSNGALVRCRRRGEAERHDFAHGWEDDLAHSLTPGSGGHLPGRRHLVAAPTQDCPNTTALDVVQNEEKPRTQRRRPRCAAGRSEPDSRWVEMSSS